MVCTERPAFAGRFCLRRLQNPKLPMYNAHGMKPKTKTKSSAAITFSIEADTLHWIRRACQTEDARAPREILRYAALVHFKNHTWLIATDTHRIHAFRVSDLPTEPHEPIVIDIHRLIIEMGHTRRDTFRFDFAQTGKSTKCENLGICNGASNAAEISLADFAHLVFPIGTGKLPEYERVIDPVWEIRTPPPVFAINGEYLADAARLNPNKSIFIFGEKSDTPILVLPNENSQMGQWFAVIMPMDFASADFAEFADFKFDRSKR